MQRLIIVSNRLPINVQPGTNGDKWIFKLSSGGLVSALTGVKETTKFLWIGWPGIDVEDDDKQKFCNILLEQYSALPVFIDQKTSNLHYNGFSNSTIWPLFHYLPGEINFNDEQWSGYTKANQIFADRIAELVEDGDLLWIHDYHLMLLPQMLRQRCKKNISIGFFLHIPFPASDIYRVLPYRQEILCGLLASDLVGFHTYDYARHFITSCTRILGLNSSPASVEYNGREVRVGAYPVGIEPGKFLQALHEKETVDEIEKLLAKFSGLKVIVGVERLDYIKGLTQKLLAYESFLEDHAEMRGKVVLIQIAIPSRTDVEEYQHLQNHVFELIGRINGKFSTTNYSPVQFLYTSVNFNQLVALYRSADVCLITSIRDGMNLVAYEYIACQKDRNGVLILSEFAGAAQSLNGVILINPWSLNQIKNALFEAINMEKSDRQLMFSYLSSYVDKFTSSHWGSSFVTDLLSSHELICHNKIKSISLNDINSLNLQKILVLIESTKVESEFVASIVQAISQTCHKNMIFCLYSHRQRDIDINKPPSGCKLISNFGMSISENGLEYQHILIDSNNEMIAHKSIIDMCNYYVKRCPGSKLYFEKFYILWDFSQVEKSLADWTSCELQINLENMIGHQPLKVTRDHHSLVISNASFDLVKSLKDSLLNICEKSGAEILLYHSDSEIFKKAGTSISGQLPVLQLQIPSEYFGSKSCQQ